MVFWTIATHPHESTAIPNPRIIFGILDILNSVLAGCVGPGDSTALDPEPIVSPPEVGAPLAINLVGDGLRENLDVRVADLISPPAWPAHTSSVAPGSQAIRARMQHGSTRHPHGFTRGMPRSGGNSDPIRRDGARV